MRHQSYVVSQVRRQICNMFTTGKQKKRKGKGNDNISLNPEFFMSGGFFRDFVQFLVEEKLTKNAKEEKD